MWNLKSASSVIIRDSDKKNCEPPAARMENYETYFVRSAYKTTGLTIGDHPAKRSKISDG